MDAFTFILLDVGGDVFGEVLFEYFRVALVSCNRHLEIDLSVPEVGRLTQFIRKFRQKLPVLFAFDQRCDDFCAEDGGSPGFVGNGLFLLDDVEQIFVEVGLEEGGWRKHLKQLLQHFDHVVASILHVLDGLDLVPDQAVEQLRLVFRWELRHKSA